MSMIPDTNSTPSKAPLTTTSSPGSDTRTLRERWADDGVVEHPLPQGMAQLSMRGGTTLASPAPGDDVELYTDAGKGAGKWQGGFVALTAVTQGELGGPYDGEDVVRVAKADDLTKPVRGILKGAEWPAQYLRIARGDKPSYATTDAQGGNQEGKQDGLVDKTQPKGVATFYRKDQRRGYHGKWVDEGRVKGGPEVEEPVEEGTPEQQQANAYQMAVLGITRESVKQAIIHSVNDASPEQRKAGMMWYFDQNRFGKWLGEKWGVPYWRIIGAIAATSPQTHWDPTYNPMDDEWEVTIKNSNQLIVTHIADLAFDPAYTQKKYTITEKDAKEYEQAQVDAWQAAYDEAVRTGGKLPHRTKIKSLRAYNGSDPFFKPGTSFVGTFKLDDLPADVAIEMESKHVGYMHNNAAKALRMLRGEDADDALGGSGKTRSFYNNLLLPDDPRWATIDVHMARAIVSNPALTDKMLGKMVENGARYRIMRDGIIDAANQLGMLPQQAQAITWVAWKDAHSAPSRAAISRKLKAEGKDV